MTVHTESGIRELPVCTRSHSKTLDAGRDGHTVSCGPLGDILQLGSFHPVHGMIVACPFEQFDGTRFHDPEYVRVYRKKLLDHVRSGTRGMGINFKGEATDLRLSFLDNQWILVRYSIGLVDVLTTISINNSGVVEQSSLLHSSSNLPTQLDYTLSLKISLNRASYGQLTEGGPIPIPESTNDFKLVDAGYHWTITNKNLDAIVHGNLSLNDRPIFLGSSISDEVFNGTPALKQYCGSINLLPNTNYVLKSTFGLQPGRAISKESICRSLSLSGASGHWKLGNEELGLIVQRNLEYILGNCTLPVGKDVTCFITDHVALPLGWNRDNYWQIRFLLDVHHNLGKIAYPNTAQTYATRIHKSVKGHIKWLFSVSQRPLGYWHRSYLANGVPKDGPVFQQDQQCYPLLELCDFYEEFPCDRDFVESILHGDTVLTILDILETRRDPETALYRTEETPGDDAVEYPFHFSSHVLLWYTMKRLSKLLKSFPGVTTPSHAEIDTQTETLKAIILKNFVAQHPETRETIFAYLTDGAGTHTFYHDANDIPTTFALDWGFVDKSTEKIWKQTMAFGLSPLNVGGFYPDGEFGGLGSVHTQGPWPLGYAQEFMFASLTGNDVAKEHAWRRIRGSMFWDGLFPEAVDGQTGDCVSKAWFSWPGSMIGSALLRFGVRAAVEPRSYMKLKKQSASDSPVNTVK